MDRVGKYIRGREEEGEGRNASLFRGKSAMSHYGKT